MEYTVIRSDRRSTSIQIVKGEIVVRTGRRTSVRQIEKVLKEHEDWIRRTLRRYEESREKADTEKLSEDDIKKLTEEAREYIPGRVKYYAGIAGLEYNRITIRHQKKRWGSCSSKGNLNFNCLLMLAPKEVVDSVVVHELCHLIEMNHSDRFYRQVLKLFPDYYKWNRWLTKNGTELMMRAE